MNYQDAANKLKGKTEKRIGNNTTLKYDLDDYVIRYHNTDIIRIHADNTYTLNTDGFLTYTTKERINNLTPAKIYQKAGIWYLGINAHQSILYFDGMCIDQNGLPLNHLQPENQARVKQYEKNLKTYNKLVKQYITGFEKHCLSLQKMPEISNADCFFCLFQTEKVSLGDAIHDGSHLLLHLRERYYVPSLLWNAFQKFGIPQVVWNWQAQNLLKQDTTLIHDALKTFFRKRKREILAAM